MLAGHSKNSVAFYSSERSCDPSGCKHSPASWRRRRYDSSAQKRGKNQMTLVSMLKKTPEPSISSMPKEQRGRLLRRVWASGTEASARLHVGSLRPSPPTTGHLYTSQRCASLLRLLGRLQECSLGILPASQALSGDLGRPQALAKAIPQEKTHLRYLRQLLTPPN